MGSLKNKALKSDVTKYVLLDNEVNYLRVLNVALAYNTLKDKLMSGFLYYVAISRLGYKDGHNLEFSIDLEKEDKELTVTDRGQQEVMESQPESQPSPGRS